MDKGKETKMGWGDRMKERQEKQKGNWVDRMKERDKVRRSEYKASKAKELKEGTRTAVTLQQVVSTVGIIMFVLGALGLLLIYGC